MLGHRKSPLLPVASALTALLLATACRTAAPPAGGSGRVILVSLDGASATELHRLYQAGALQGGGFSRFYDEGEVASSLTPVDPTLTAVNHISLATGFPPAQTGIVSNNFRVADSPWGERTSGFAAPIGTETLWEAAKRQGKRTGVWAFPGADDTSPRRRGDWGLTYVGRALRTSSRAYLSRASFRPSGAGEAEPADLPQHFGSALSARVEIDEGSPEAAGRSLELIALDVDDDGEEAYGELLVSSPGSDRARQRLVPGGWCRIVWSEVPSGAAVRWIKLLDFPPDLSRVRLYIGAEYANQAYPPKFAADLADRDLIWPGPPDDDSYEATWEGKPGIDLSTWTEQTARFGDFFLDGIAYGAGRPDWDLLLGYVPTIDEAGHELLLEESRQPQFTPERKNDFAAARRDVWQSIDRGLARLLAAVDLRTTTVILVSDHGMVPVVGRIDPNALLRKAGLASLGTDGRVVPAASRAMAISSGGVSHIYLAPGVTTSQRSPILADLRRRFARLAIDGKHGIDRIFAHDELGPLGLDHPNSGDLVLFARVGFTFAEWPLPGGAISAPTDVYGMHGYLYQGGKGDPRLAGIYLALGRGIEKRTLGQVKNTDVALRVAAYLGIEPPRRTP